MYNNAFCINISFVYRAFSALFVITSGAFLYCCRMESKPNLLFEAVELVLNPSKQAATVEKFHLSQVAEGVPFVPKDPEDVLEEAKVRVIHVGGCPFDDLMLAS